MGIISRQKMSADFIHEITDFMEDNGVGCETFQIGETVLIRAGFRAGGEDRSLLILPAGISARTVDEARLDHERRQAAIRTAGNAVTLAEDRWRSQARLYRARLLAHAGKFRRISARDCEAVRTDRMSANLFLAGNHSYGPAACRHCYSLVEKKSGETVAAATFSNARRWQKGGKTVRSYEWVRYASVCGTRVAGGMGKLLSRFIADVEPDDIMSYADIEWSGGGVYRHLGFAEDGVKAPVLFRINPVDWTRTPAVSAKDTGPSLWYMNGGSLKYRLKLTDYRD